MSTTSTCQSQSSWSSWDVWAIGNAWIHAWKHSRAQHPVFFSGKVAVCGCRWRVSVSAVARLDLGKWSTKRAQDCSESSTMSQKNQKNWRACATFWRWGRQSVHETVARARFHIKSVKNWHLWSTFGNSFIHFNTFMSIHSFQFTHCNSFMSTPSCQFLPFNSLSSTHSLQFVHFNSMVLIYSFIRFNSFMPHHSFHSNWFASIPCFNFLSIHSCQFSHYNSFVSIHAF